MTLSVTVTVTVNGFDLFPLMVLSVTVTVNLNHTDSRSCMTILSACWWCDVAGIPRSVGVLSVVRWAGVLAVPTAYVGNSARGLSATSVSLSRYPVPRVAHPKHHSSSGRFQRGPFPRLGARPIVV